jgi:hypothetical protein
MTKKLDTFHMYGLLDGISFVQRDIKAKSLADAKTKLRAKAKKGHRITDVRCDFITPA